MSAVGEVKAVSIRRRGRAFEDERDRIGQVWIVTWVGLACLALAVRPLLFGVTPLLPQVQLDLGTSYAVTALLVSVPVFCLGIASFVGAWLAGRVGIVPTAGVALATMVAAGVARAMLPDVDGMIFASVPLGIGAGIAGVLLPMLVKATVPMREAATATSVYTVGMQAGGALTATVAVPLAAAAGGWRPAFGIIAGASAIAVAGWLVVTRRTPRVRHDTRWSPPAGSNHFAWLAATVAAFSLLVVVFQGVNAWLPTLYVEFGWSEAAGGALLAVLVFAQVPGTLAAGVMADRAGQRRTYVLVPSIILSVSIILLVALPQAGWLWAVLAGLALGFIAPIILVIALDFGADIHAVGRSSGTILGLGYLVAAASPFAIGIARDATGSFALGLSALAVLALAIAVSSFSLPADRPLTSEEVG